MSLDPQFLESGRFNNERNPLAFQLEYTAHPHGITRDPDNNITNADEVIQDLANSVHNLARAVAVLEDQISELRGAPVKPEDALIHGGVGRDSVPEVEDDSNALSYSDAAVIDPSIDL